MYIQHKGCSESWTLRSRRLWLV